MVAPRDPDEDSVLLLADLAPGCLARLFDRFGLPILTVRELRDQENRRLDRMDSPLRL